MEQARAYSWRTLEESHGETCGIRARSVVEQHINDVVLQEASRGVNQEVNDVVTVRNNKASGAATNDVTHVSSPRTQTS